MAVTAAAVEGGVAAAAGAGAGTGAEAAAVAVGAVGGEPAVFAAALLVQGVVLRAKSAVDGKRKVTGARGWFASCSGGGRDAGRQELGDSSERAPRSAFVNGLGCCCAWPACTRHPTELAVASRYKRKLCTSCYIRKRNISRQRWSLWAAGKEVSKTPLDENASANMAQPPYSILLNAHVTAAHTPRTTPKMISTSPPPSR